MHNVLRAIVTPTVTTGAVGGIGFAAYFMAAIADTAHDGIVLFVAGVALQAVAVVLWLLRALRALRSLARREIATARNERRKLREEIAGLRRRVADVEASDDHEEITAILARNNGRPYEPELAAPVLRLREN